MKLAVFLSLFLVPMPAWAASCSVSASGVSFATYIPSSPTPAMSSATVSITCFALLTQNITYSLSLNAGVNSGGSYYNRRMANGSAYLSYQLYSNSARSQVWGNGSNGTSVVTGSCFVLFLTCNSSNTIYGSIPINQSPTPGSYIDTVTITISY
jgi:spore coat protein U-like protein